MSLFGGGLVCVWGGIFSNGTTDFINQAMTALRFHDRVIEPIIVSFPGAIGEEFVLVDDNARPHRAGIVNDRIEYHGITRMD